MSTVLAAINGAIVVIGMYRRTAMYDGFHAHRLGGDMCRVKS